MQLKGIAMRFPVVFPALLVTFLGCSAHAISAPAAAAGSSSGSPTQANPSLKAAKESTAPPATVPNGNTPSDKKSGAGPGQEDDQAHLKSPGVPRHEHGEEEAEPENEDLVDYFWRKSDAAFHAGDYPRAIALHRAIVILAPDELESYSVGSWLMWSLGNGQEALDFIASGLKANPEDPEMWDIAGQQYDLQKKRPEAQKAYRKAIELSGAQPPQMLQRRYAHASERAGDLTASLEAWQRLVKQFPDSPVDKNNLKRVEGLVKGSGGGSAGAASA